MALQRDDEIFQRMEALLSPSSESRAREVEVDENEHSCVVCSLSRPISELLFCPFDATDGRPAQAVCGQCYSQPSNKVQETALVQLAGEQAGLRSPLCKTFGRDSRAVYKDLKLVGHVCYAPYKPPGDPFDARAGYICASHAKIGCYYSEGEAVSPEDAAGPSAGGLGLAALLGEIPLAKDSSRAETGRADVPFARDTSRAEAAESQPSRGVGNLLDLLELDATDSERRESLRGAIQDGELSGEAAQLATLHLDWDSQKLTFEQESCTDEAWSEFVLALRQLLKARLGSPAVSPGMTLAQELTKFHARATILARTSAGLSRVPDAAAALSQSARATLTIVGFDPVTRKFGTGRADDTLFGLTKLNAFLSTESAPEQRPTSSLGAVSGAPGELQELGLDPELLQRRDFQAAARTARLQEMVPVRRLEGAKLSDGALGWQALQQPSAAPTSMAAGATSKLPSDALKLRDLFCRVLANSDSVHCSGASPPQTAISLFDNRAHLKHYVLGTRSGGNWAADWDDDMPGALRIASAGPPLAASIVFMQAMTATHLKLYFKATQRYIQDNEPQMSELWSRVREFVKGKQNTFEEFNVFTPKAPHDELSHTMEVGRLFFVRNQALHPTSAAQGGHTLDALINKLSSHCAHQETLGVTKQQAALQLFSLLGLAKADKMLGAVPAKGALELAAGKGTVGATPVTDLSKLAAPYNAKALHDSWVGANTKAACSNCAGSHRLPACTKARRADLPCQICYGLMGTHHEKFCTLEHMDDPRGREQFVRLRYYYWAARNGAVDDAPSGADDGASGNL